MRRYSTVNSAAASNVSKLRHGQMRRFYDIHITILYNMHITNKHKLVREKLNEYSLIVQQRLIVTSQALTVIGKRTQAIILHTSETDILSLHLLISSHERLVTCSQ